jgi:glucose/mannose-6-phosphate isomerase
MKALVQNFLVQLKEAREIGRNANVRAEIGSQVSNVIISGLGGSGIGGTIVQEMIQDKCPKPVFVNKDYFLPAFAGASTLVIACSYSGNTEETIQALQIALEKGCRVVCITSGGEIQKIAEKNGLDLILIPGGMPPRACLTYSLTQIIHVLAYTGIMPSSILGDFDKAVTATALLEKEIITYAGEIAAKMHNKLPVIYTVAGYEGVAIRLRQQLNENSKMLAWHHVIPEMNHNELVGWTKEDHGLCVIFFRNSDDYGRVQKRIEICREIISRYTPNILEIYSKGETKMERTLYFILLSDWISVYLAEIKSIDATEVKVIDYMKSSLAKS